MRSDPPPPPAAPLTPFAASPPNHCWPLSESSRETAVGGSVAPSEVLEKEASLSASSPAGGQRGEAHRSVEPASMRVDGRTVSPPHRQSGGCGPPSALPRTVSTRPPALVSEAGKMEWMMGDAAVYVK